MRNEIVESEVIESLYDHRDQLVMSPRLTWMAIKDKLDWKDIENTNPEYIWDRYLLPVLIQPNCKVFAR